MGLLIESLVESLVESLADVQGSELVEGHRGLRRAQPNPKFCYVSNLPQKENEFCSPETRFPPPSNNDSFWSLFRGYGFLSS